MALYRNFWAGSPMKHIITGLNVYFKPSSTRNCAKRFDISCSYLPQSTWFVSRTFSSKSFRELKRFYNAVEVEKNEEGFQVTLDKRPVKTPLGNRLCIPSEGLSMAVVAEWNAQEEIIQPDTMNLTSLCNTVIDNPSKRTCTKQVEDILEYLLTDTICYPLEDPPELVELQEKEWTPLLEWFTKRYDVTLPTNTTLLPCVPEKTLETLRMHFLLMNRWTLAGIEHATESIKSLVIPMALINKQLTIEHAAYVSRLELEFQISRWGNVEWAHDVELMDTRSRLAAAVLFYNFTKDIKETKDLL